MKGTSAKPALRVLIAGGGTGGHLFPGIAIAEAFREKAPGSRILFAGTGKPFEVATVAGAGFEHRRITAAGIKGMGLWRQVRSAVKLPWGLGESILILRRFDPDLVVGVGGYSAGPVVLAAWLRRTSIVLQEQNLFPGITNRILSRLADRIYVSFEETRTHLNPEKCRVMGNPIRREILEKFKAEARVQDEGDKGRFTLLVMGGSQGAHRINLAMMEAAGHLREPGRYHIIHQTGVEDESRVAEAYGKLGLSCTVQAFFRDMAVVYRKSDLLVCRAGASTVAEITAVGKAAVFIPFPHAADDHQTLNVRALEAGGAAETIPEHDLTGKLLAQRIETYAAHPEKLKEMGKIARSFGRPDAAGAIVEDCLRLLTIND